MARWLLFALLVAVAGPLSAHDDGDPSGAPRTLSPFWIGPGVSGSWFDPARDGEGFTLQLLDDGSAVVVWFTFAPAGSAHPQAWILGQGGVVAGDTVTFPTVVTARGGRFGPAFDPAAVVLEPWGSLSFTFTDCDHATVRWQGPPAFGAGTRALERLTVLDELDCGGTRRLTARGARDLGALRSRAGAWVDPTHTGEGWVIEPFSPTLAGMYWFSYDDAGNPAWFLGLGTFDGDRLVIADALRPVGTAFGDAFDAAQVQRPRWGRVEFRFLDCNRVEVSYQAAPGFGDGRLDAQRLTRLASAPCLDAVAPTVALSGSWSLGPALAVAESEVSVAELDGAFYVAGGLVGRPTFQRFDLAAQRWERLPDLPDGRDHAAMLTHAGSVWVFGGYGTSGPNGLARAFRFDVAAGTWEIYDGITAVSASGAARLNGYFWLGDENGDLVQFDPVSRASRRIPARDGALRDHSQLVAFQGELWLMGGRSLSTGEQNRVTIFDPVSETWRLGPGMRAGRAGFAAAALPDRVLVAGGEVLLNGNLVLDSIESIAAGEDGWTYLARMPTGVHGVGGLVHQGRFYAIGGSTVPGTTGNPGTLQIFTPAP